MKIYLWEIVVAIVGIPVALTVLWWLLLLVCAPFMAIRGHQKGGAHRR